MSKLSLKPHVEQGVSFKDYLPQGPESNRLNVQLVGFNNTPNDGFYSSEKKENPFFDNDIQFLGTAFLLLWGAVGAINFFKKK